MYVSMEKLDYILTTSEEKRVAKEVLRKRVTSAHDKLISAQLSLALGSHYLFKIEYDPETQRKSRPKLVVDPMEMQEYLEGNTSEKTDYYFFMAEKPDNKAIDSLMDRAFGKPQTHQEDQPDATDSIGVIAYPIALPTPPTPPNPTTPLLTTPTPLLTTPTTPTTPATPTTFTTST